MSTKKSRRTKKKTVPETKPYVLITVSGGVADIGISEGAEVDILDFDNLKDINPGHLRSLSDREWEYLKKHDPQEYARLWVSETPSLVESSQTLLDYLIEAHESELENAHGGDAESAGEAPEECTYCAAIADARKALEKVKEGSGPAGFFTSEELATTLAALRYWQRATGADCLPVGPLEKSAYMDHFSFSGDVEDQCLPLNADEIDGLCERINK